MADYQGPYSGAQVDAAIKAATELQPKVKELEDAVTLQGAKTSLNEAEIGQLKDSKADKEGYYSSLVAGAAENLINTTGDGVVRELTYDTAGGNADIGTGTAIIKRMRGKSLVWNQRFIAYPTNVGTKVVNGVTYTLTAEGDLTAEGTAEGTSAVFVVTATDLINTHKYLINAPSVESSWNTWALYFNGYTTPPNSSIVGRDWKIFQATNTNTANMVLTCWAGKTISVKTRVTIYDLTQMFGAGNEPATIEEFKRLFPRDDYAYNEGEVIHFNGRRLLTTGFNQWDEQWEPGSYSRNDGKPVTDPSLVRCKNAIAVLPNMTYHFNISIPSSLTDKSYMGFVLFYDADDNFIGSNPMGGNYYQNVLIPSNARYIRFYLRVEYGTTYKDDICVNLSWSGYRDGEYEPYEEHILELPYGVYGDGLKSAGTAYDEVTEERYVKRIGVVDMGDLDWVENGVVTEGAVYQYRANNFTSKPNFQFIIEPNPHIVEAIARSTGTLVINSDILADATSFKAAMSGVMLYYELAEPEVTEFETPLNLGYYVNDFGTEMILPENGIAPFTAPVVFDILYAMNAVDTLRNLPTNYISKESFDNFTAALSSALANAGITMSIKATFDEESGTYNYTITASKTE